jgi:hypothetical protein
MNETNTLVRTEIRGLEVRLDGQELGLSADGDNLIAPIPLQPDDAERVRLELAKAQLWEWNLLEELKSRAELRYRRYLGSWLVMCLAAFSAYLGYPSYVLCLVLAMLSIFLWWRAGFAEQQADREAQAQRKTFRPNWEYLQHRLEEPTDEHADQAMER